MYLDEFPAYLDKALRGTSVFSNPKHINTIVHISVPTKQYFSFSHFPSFDKEK
jgi:hypothetical protein